MSSYCTVWNVGGSHEHGNEVQKSDLMLASNCYMGTCLSQACHASTKYNAQVTNDHPCQQQSNIEQEELIVFMSDERRPLLGMVLHHLPSHPHTNCRLIDFIGFQAFTSIHTSRVDQIFLDTLLQDTCPLVSGNCSVDRD